jgi:predicted transcriptional regulator of viral defense system
MVTESVENPPAVQQRQSRLSPLVRRIEGEYHEMPGLKLTEAQARRLWGLDPNTCRVVLVTLMQKRFLRRTADGMYVRAGV